jgi:hypothetical protein
MTGCVCVHSPPQCATQEPVCGPPPMPRLQNVTPGRRMLNVRRAVGMYQCPRSWCRPLAGTVVPSACMQYMAYAALPHEPWPAASGDRPLPPFSLACTPCPGTAAGDTFMEQWAHILPSGVLCGEYGHCVKGLVVGQRRGVWPSATLHLSTGMCNVLVGRCDRGGDVPSANPPA